MIKVHVKHAFQIGDALCHIPYMKHLCDKHNTGAVVTGEFNHLVRYLIGSNYPFVFTGSAEGDFEAQYEMHMAAMFGYSSQCHMVQSFFKPRNEPTPELPMALTLKREPCGVPPGIVVSPYSHSDMNGNKLWSHSNWVEVIRQLRAAGHERFYLVGGSGRDDPAPYAEDGVELYFDHQLSQVLDLVQQSPLLLSIDNGISHLAQFGGVSRHVLLYPGCLSPCWARNPRGLMVTAPMPAQVQPQHIVQAAKQVLDGKCRI